MYGFSASAVLENIPLSTSSETGRDIEDDEPMKRNFSKKGSKGKLDLSQNLNNGTEKEDRLNEAVPVTKEALLGGILQNASHYEPLPEGAGEEEDELSGSRRKGKEKKERSSKKKGGLTSSTSEESQTKGRKDSIAA